MFPRRRRKQPLLSTLKNHEYHPKFQTVGGGTDGNEYLMILCACGEMIVYDKIRILEGDPYNVKTYGGVA